MSAFTLDDIRAAAEAKYGSTDIKLSSGNEVRLLNPLRLPKEKRAALQGLQEAMEAEGSDQEEELARAIHLIAATPAQADALLAEVDGDLALLATIFERYTEGAQVGEASASRD